MDDTDLPSRAWPRTVLFLGLVTILVVAYLALPHDSRAEAVGSELLVVLASVISAIAIVRWASGWPGSREIAAMWGLIGLAELVFLVLDLADAGAYGPRPADVSLLLFLVPLALAMRAEYAAHFDAKDQRAIAIDVVVISMSMAAIAYVVMRPAGADGLTIVSTAVMSILGACVFTSFAALALWVPSRPHLLVFLAAAIGSIAILQFGWEWTHLTFDGSSIPVDIPFLLAPLGFAITMTTVAHGASASAPVLPRLARPVLTSAAVLTACAALLVVTILDDAREISAVESTSIVLLLGGAIAARMISNQMEMAASQREIQEALQRRETALEAADRALGRVRDANETLRGSEEHLRLVFEAAVDGLVELDAEGTVVRANDAFASMVGLDRATIEGVTWGDVVARIDGADPGFLQLPETGQGQIALSEGQTRFLESRASRVPTDPPRRLLAIRDVTPAKVADRTIRSLFQFLQDRDEDRTRLLRRTNAAIEQERNRIARDLHDGPVQGVSAASLSLEAALLMIKAGDLDGGLEVLTTLRREIAGEADALRRLMAGLRPPVLEERGLMPALRDSLMRFGSEEGLQAEFSGQLQASLPPDLETLAYRVVQEALTNIGKHAGATRVSVFVGADQNQLRIEVEDDGRGFETANAREYLAAGRVGLASMRERVELASGTFAVRSTPGRGTAVMATIPLDAALAIVSVS
jgi:PAS domain S-box-containing protein